MAGRTTKADPEAMWEVDVGRKVGLDLEAITEAAVAIVESDGFDAATLSSVAAALGVKVPSMYNHVSGLAGLQRLIALHAADQLTRRYETACTNTDDTPHERLRGIALAHRRFALDHPGLYRALLPAPKPGEDDELYEAMGRPVRVVATALASDPDPGAHTTFELAPETIHRLRALRSLIHGFVDLELNAGFGIPVDIDASFDAAVDLVVTDLVKTMNAEVS